MVISYPKLSNKVSIYVLKGEESKNAVKIATYPQKSKLSPHFGFMLSSTLT